MTNEILHGEEERVYGGSGYIRAKKHDDAIRKNKNGKNIKYIINRRPCSIKKLSPSGQYAAKENISVDGVIMERVNTEDPF